MQEQGKIIVTHAAVIGNAVLDAALKPGSRVYLAWDSRVQRLFVVQWLNGTKWRCSCHNSACEHKPAVNDYAFALSQQRRMPVEDLAAHVEDEFGLNQ
ncbi:MAG: hypothetical protein ACRDHZ_00725 [Ktedonobacteraceae bacterium]